jgi:hypothetical protein
LFGRGERGFEAERLGVERTVVEKPARDLLVRGVLLGRRRAGLAEVRPATLVELLALPLGFSASAERLRDVGGGRSFV